MKQIKTSGVTAITALLIALGGGATGGAMVLGHGSSTAPVTPPTVGMKVADDSELAPTPEPTVAAPTPTPAAAEVSVVEPVTAPASQPRTVAPVTAPTNRDADRAEEPAATPAPTPKPVVATPAPTPKPVVTPEPTPEPTPECAPEGGTVTQTETWRDKPYRTRQIHCTNGKSVYDPWVVVGEGPDDTP